MHDISADHRNQRLRRPGPDTERTGSRGRPAGCLWPRARAAAAAIAGTFVESPSHSDYVSASPVRGREPRPVVSAACPAPRPCPSPPLASAPRPAPRPAPAPAPAPVPVLVFNVYHDDGSAEGRCTKAHGVDPGGVLGLGAGGQEQIRARAAAHAKGQRPLGRPVLDEREGQLHRRVRRRVPLGPPPLPPPPRTFEDGTGWDAA